MTELDDPPADMIVKGPNQMTAMPIDVHVTYTEIAHCLDKSISKIETAITNALERILHLNSMLIFTKGYLACRWRCLLRGLDKRLYESLTSRSGLQKIRCVLLPWYYWCCA